MEKGLHSIAAVAGSELEKNHPVRPVKGAKTVLQL